MRHSDARRPASAYFGLERLTSVKERTGLSSSEIYRRAAASTFPKPVKLGPRSSAWSTAEVDAWIADRISDRDTRCPPVGVSKSTRCGGGHVDD